MLSGGAFRKWVLKTHTVRGHVLFCGSLIILLSQLDGSHRAKGVDHLGVDSFKMALVPGLQRPQHLRLSLDTLGVMRSRLKG